MGGEVLEKSWTTLKKGGRLISIAEIPNEELAAKHEISANFCFVQANSGQLSEISNLIDAGDITVEVNNVFRLDDIAKAHQKSESGHTRGKIVIQIQEE